MEKERLKQVATFGGVLALQALFGIAIFTLLAGHPWWFSFMYLGGTVLVFALTLSDLWPWRRPSV